MTTKSAHDELKEWLDKSTDATYPDDLIRRAIAEHGSLAVEHEACLSAMSHFQDQRNALQKERDELRAALEIIARADRWSCNVVSGNLGLDRDGPWVMVDHKKIAHALSSCRHRHWR